MLSRGDPDVEQLCNVPVSAIVEVCARSSSPVNFSREPSSLVGDKTGVPDGIVDVGVLPDDLQLNQLEGHCIWGVDSGHAGWRRVGKRVGGGGGIVRVASVSAPIMAQECITVSIHCGCVLGIGSRCVSNSEPKRVCLRRIRVRNRWVYICGGSAMRLLSLLHGYYRVGVLARKVVGSVHSSFRNHKGTTIPFYK